MSSTVLITQAIQASATKKRRDRRSKNHTNLLNYQKREGFQVSSDSTRCDDFLRHKVWFRPYSGDASSQVMFATKKTKDELALLGRNYVYVDLAFRAAVPMYVAKSFGVQSSQVKSVMDSITTALTKSSVIKQDTTESKQCMIAYKTKNADRLHKLIRTTRATILDDMANILFLKPRKVFQGYQFMDSVKIKCSKLMTNDVKFFDLTFVKYRPQYFFIFCFCSYHI